MKNEPLFPHKSFLNKNGIDIDKLPADLKKRIYGFEELEQDLLTTIDEDRVQLLSRMEDLSDELDEDLEEHFEELLDNNDHQDEEAEPMPGTPEQVEQHECACKHAKKEYQEHEPTFPKEPERPVSPAEKVLTDEEILSKFHESGLRKISPEDLKKNGFKAPLNFRVIAVGKFYLRRPKYDTHYQILLAWD